MTARIDTAADSAIDEEMAALSDLAGLEGAAAALRSVNRHRDAMVRAREQRQRAVSELKRDGMSVAEIAEALGVSRYRAYGILKGE